MGPRIIVGIFACVALIAFEGGAGAQRDKDPSSVDGDAGGTARIPVSVPSDPEAQGAERSATTAPTAPISVEEPVDAEQYICGPGDAFELNFWGQQNFRLHVSVDLEGRTFISKVGFVSVAGKTLAAVRKAIKDKVRANYPGLQFELSLAAPRTFLVHLVSNVAKPGVYSANAVERLSTVLARAKGITGSSRRIQIRHRNGTESRADLQLYELTGDATNNPHLLDGDTVVVPFAEVTVTVAGAVRRSGSFELVKTKDIAELIDLAGGLTTDAVRTMPIRIVRRNENQREVFESVPFPSTGVPNAALHDGDRVVISGSQDVQRTVLLIGAVTGAESIDAASTSKRLPFVEGDTVWSLIERAGGVKAPGDLQRSYIARPQKNDVPKVIPVDLEALLVRRDLRADVPIAMGDTIVVPPMQYSILVEGAVARAGLYPYNPAFSVPEYLARAGGRTHNAQDISEVKLIGPDGNTRPFRTGIKLNAGDAILVPERNWTRAEIVQLVMGGMGLVLSGIAVTYAVTR